MFIDFLTLIMINLVAGFAILAYYVWKGLKAEDQRPYSAVFTLVGLLALIMGLRLAFSWPLPGSYNIGYGEATALFGIVFLGAGISLSQRWNLFPVALYAFFAGIYAVITGVRILSLGLTKEPLISAVGFILAGLCGVLAAFYLKWLKDYKIVRLLALLLILVTAVIWAVTFFGALWDHLESFGKWAPAAMSK